MKESDVLFHLAASVGVKKVIRESEKTLRNNLSATASLIRCALRFGKKVILLSSSEVYGQGNGAPLKEAVIPLEKIPKGSRWAYAYSKAAGESLGLYCHRRYRLPVVIVRLFNTVGARQIPDHGMVLPTLIQQALSGIPLSIFGDGTQKRCFAQVGDIVGGIIRLSEEPKAVGEIVNLGSREEVSIRDLALRIKEKTGSSSPISFVPYSHAYGFGFEDIRRRVPDLERAESLVHFEPRFSLNDILDQLIAPKLQKTALCLETCSRRE